MAKRLSRIEENTETIIKQNDKTDTKLDMILDQNKEIKTAVDKNSKKLDAITKMIEDGILVGYHKTDIGDYYPKYLAVALLKSDIPEKNWEAEIGMALGRYIDGKAQLSQSIGLTPKLEAKRKQALALFEKAKLDEAEALLLEIDKELLGQFEKAAKDRATLLADRAAIAAARLDFDAAISLYEQAAQTTVTIDEVKAVDWLWNGGDIGRERYEIGGDPHFAKRAVKLYQFAIGYISTENNRASKGQETRWAGLHNNLGGVYQVMGERGTEGALEQAIAAYENALLERTRAKAPMAWAGTQENLGLALWAQGKKDAA